jgi:hypothetical protein
MAVCGIITVRHNYLMTGSPSLFPRVLNACATSPLLIYMNNNYEKPSYHLGIYSLGLILAASSLISVYIRSISGLYFLAV